MTAFQEFIVIAGPCVLEHNRGAVNRQTAETLKGIVERVQKATGVPIRFYFKSSYDKANRTSIDSYRGPGLEEGLAILSEIKADLGVRLLTDVHQVSEVAPATEVVDMIQIPAFLCRQTDLLVEAGRAAGARSVAVNIKKGQFVAPHDMGHAGTKVRQAGCSEVYMTERGSSFGYNNLVVDMRSIPIIQGMGYPLIFDATHSVQLPGGQGATSGGKREYAPVLARAAVAAGCSGLFFETHPNPDEALSDGANMIPLAWVEDVLTTCLRLHQVVREASLQPV